MLVPLVLAMLQQGSSDAFDRAQSLYGNVSSVEADLTISVTDIAEVAGHYSFLSPGLQRVRVEGKGVHEEFVASKGRTLLVDHLDKSYYWYPPTVRAQAPPPEACHQLHFGMPPVIAAGGPGGLAPKNLWASKGRSSLEGAATDEIEAVVVNNDGTRYTLRLWIGATGTILMARKTFQVQGSPVNVTTKFANTSFSAIPPGQFDFEIADGYSPTRIPVDTIRVSTGEASKIGTASKLDGGALVDLDKALKPRKLVLFTSNDLVEEDSKVWAPVAAAAKKAGVDFAQVWLGGKPVGPAGSWPSFWDKDGQIEARLGLIVTPYVLAFDGETVVSGWQGVPGPEDDPAKTLLSPFSDE